MEENKETREPEQPAQPVVEAPVETPQQGPQQGPNQTPTDDQAGKQPDRAEQPGEQKPQSPDVTMAVTLNGQVTKKRVRFHTPTLLAEVKKLDDAAEVEILAEPADPSKENPQTLLKGAKKDAVEALEHSIVKPADIVGQFQRLVRFLVDHSNLKAIGVELVCLDENGDTAGAGFVSTTEDCTVAQAVALVNCGDANLDEFITKAKLDIPNRKGAAEKGTIIAPTPEQVRKLG